MKDDQFRFLSVMGHLPARLTVEQTAWVLNCQPHDIPLLVAGKLLRPLGNPPANAVKYFSTSDIQELAQDRNWLARASAAIYQHWQTKNSRRRKSLRGSLPVMVLPPISAGGVN